MYQKMKKGAGLEAKVYQMRELNILQGKLSW
jgi:hypothetical protein